MKNILVIPAMVCAISGAVYLAHASSTAAENLPEPTDLILTETDESKKDMILAARRYAAFWNTGDPKYAKEALADNFMDRTLPEGREQGVKGPLQASENFRKIVPDLKVGIEQMLVAGDRVVVHLSFDGHFTGEMGGVKGQGQVVSFKGTDVYKIKHGKITDNWHIEDNLKFMKQVGAVK